MLKGQPISIPRYYLAGIHQGAKSYVQSMWFLRCFHECLCSSDLPVDQPDKHNLVRFVASKTRMSPLRPPKTRVSLLRPPKTRVSPLRPQTIPRLELLSVLLSAKLMMTATKSFEPELILTKPSCYSDSKVALFW